MKNRSVDKNIAKAMGIVKRTKQKGFVKWKGMKLSKNIVSTKIAFTGCI